MFVLFLFVQLTGKSVIKFDIHFGDPDHKHENFLEYKRDFGDNNFRKRDNQAYNEAQEKKAQEEMLQNLGGLQPPKKENALVHQNAINAEKEKPKEVVRVAPAEPEYVHAFTGKTKLPPVYLDFVDLNQPWDKALEVCLLILRSRISTAIGFCMFPSLTTLHISFKYQHNPRIH